MGTEGIQLYPGENPLGQYHVAINRRTTTGWAPTVPPLTALVTNFRLILYPQTRRRYKPASIPSTYIVQVTEMDIGHYRGFRILLREGLKLYITVSWSQDRDLGEALKTMLTVPLGNRFSRAPSIQELQRLIQYIGGM
jgi:hypothetical protein